MKIIKIAPFLLIAFLVFPVKSVNAQNKIPITVLVKYKSQPGKDSVTLLAIKNLVAQVKKEPNYINIIIHTDPLDKSTILLYEQWSDEAYFKGEHMKTAHLQQFMVDARSFLGGPPDISFWKSEN